MLQSIKEGSSSNVGKYIRKDKSVKISTKAALDEHHKALHDAQMTPEELEAAKEHKDKHP